ncbi:beta-galactosidase [candidate division FCPU426 bacterium]|nr:beta-galactosidase [candidate division FCPU426 bacterium]
MTVKLRNLGWELGGTYLPWIWGQINYWDIARASWRDVLRTYQQSGHQVLSTTVLPRIHQLDSGEYDFGQARPQHDLDAFLEEAKDIGLKVILWVGPRDCPGAVAAGYPEELLRDENALARDAAGNPVLSARCFGGEVFSLPSLVSDCLTRCLRPFADSLLPVIKGRVHPDGPVIGIGLTQAPGWSTALPPFAADYQDEAVSCYQAFLRKRYGKIAALQAVYGADCASFADVVPPRQPGSPAVFPEPKLLDWACFREEYFVHAAERLHALFAPLAFDRIPLFLATIPVVRYPANLAELEKSRCFHYLMPEQPWREGGLAEKLTIAGQSRFITEWNAKFERPGGDGGNGEYEHLLGIALGVRGWDALSPAGAGTWPGFICSRQGVPVRPRSPVWDAILEHGVPDGFLTSQVFGDIVLLSIPDFERAAYLQQPLVPRWDLLDMTIPDASGPVDETTAEYTRVLRWLERFLLENHFPFLIANGNTTADRWGKNAMFLVPATSHMPMDMQAAIAQLHAKGASLMIVGQMPLPAPGAAHAPLTALLDAKPQKTKSRGKSAGSRTPAGRLLHLPDLSREKLARLLKQAGVQRPLTIDHAQVRIFFHRLRNRIFAAVVNPTDGVLETAVRHEGKFVLKDFWIEKKYHGGNNEIKIVLAPRTVKFWEMIPC